MKGHALEFYIINSLKHRSLSKKILLPIWSFKSNYSKSASPKDIEINISDLDVVYFRGLIPKNDPVPPRTTHLTKNILFVPEVSNYPDVDFLLWETSKKTLYAFQVTVGNLKDHVQKFAFFQDPTTIKKTKGFRAQIATTNKSLAENWFEYVNGIIIDPPGTSTNPSTVPNPNYNLRSGDATKPGNATAEVKVIWIAIGHEPKIDDKNMFTLDILSEKHILIQRDWGLLKYLLLK